MIHIRRKPPMLRRRMRGYTLRMPSAGWHPGPEVLTPEMEARIPAIAAIVVASRKKEPNE